ncbi:hemocyanin D chain [Trichonephila clavipes]|nr:hemocyanin D chain [Trichonephila clavipes]
MDDTSTALRDPIFYRYHRWMDNIFQEYKRRLLSYNPQDCAYLFLNVPGRNTIKRRSADSSVPTFDQLEKGRRRDADGLSTCWYPEGLRGVHIFVRLTDYEQDKVLDDSAAVVCSDAVSYCGAKDQKYPDRRAMGYSFDRPIKARTPIQFQTQNMSFTVVRIQYGGHKT